MLLAGGALCAALVWGGLRWPLAGNPDAAAFPGPETPGLPSLPQPFIALIKLVAAALIGILVTAVHAPGATDRRAGRAMQHAQILLCVAGAMMMIIIGNSLARAFGIAGAASIVRFRTPVEDPKDVTIIFLLMSLGMASGLGAFAIAGLGAAFLCVFLYVLDRTNVGAPGAGGGDRWPSAASSRPITSTACSRGTASCSRPARCRRARKRR